MGANPMASGRKPSIDRMMTRFANGAGVGVTVGEGVSVCVAVTVGVSVGEGVAVRVGVVVGAPKGGPPMLDN